MTTKVYWRDEIGDLRNLAEAVTIPDKEISQMISARQAARCMAGIASLVARRWTVDDMQRTCADLARAWIRNDATTLPHKNGIVSEQTQLIASVARSLIPIAGVANVRAALSFWATEADPASWSSIAQG